MACMQFWRGGEKVQPADKVKSSIELAESFKKQVTFHKMLQQNSASSLHLYVWVDDRLAGWWLTVCVPCAIQTQFCVMQPRNVLSFGFDIVFCTVVRLFLAGTCCEELWLFHLWLLIFSYRSLKGVATFDLPVCPCVPQFTLVQFAV